MDAIFMVKTMRNLALLAGEKILEVYERDNFDVDLKSDQSPVTQADHVADRLIFEGLRAAYPDVPIVTEEKANTHTQSHDTFFIVDPLDGTKEFIKRHGDFTVNIAYVDKGIPLYGVVYAPARGRLFYTSPDAGAVEEIGPFDHEVVGMYHLLSVSRPDPERLRIVASKSHRDAATEAYIELYKPSGSKSAGSSLKFCLVASGEADLYPRLGRTMEWDTAAGDAILRAAGGQMLCLNDLSEFVYGKPNYENPFFIAFAPSIEIYPYPK